MRGGRFASLLCLALLVALVAPLQAEPEPVLEAGFGQASLVTERRDVSLGGYGGRGLLPHIGVHDPPMVKAMVVRRGTEAVALITLDLVGIQRTLLEGLHRQGLPERVQLSLDGVLVAASHTHSSYGSLAAPTGGILLDTLFLAACGPFNEEFFHELVDRVGQALIQAWDDLAPARIGVDSALVPGLSRNRAMGGGPVDPEVGVVKVTAPDGRLRGLVVNLTAHPVVVDGFNLLASADFPGVLCRELEARYPGSTVLFTNGAEGDQSPTAPPGSYRDGWERMEAIGARMARAVDTLQQGMTTSVDLQVACRGIEARFPTPSGLRARLKAQGAPAGSLFQQLILGDAVFLGIPGEPCVRIGLDLKAAAKERGFRKAFCVGLAQDHCGYFVHAADYGPGTEEHHTYEKQWSFYGPGVGAFFETVHFERLKARPFALPTD